jgi:4-hydroxy-3-polyprenylbenzoate decarboxylase
MAYKDIREYVKELERRELLWRIKSPVKRETELMPLVRWQFRGLAEEQRRAFLFENVVDAQGRKYDSPVLVGALGASRQVYAAGLMCPIEELRDKWAKALIEPIPPKLVASGPAQEVIMKGAELEKEGLDRFPFTIDTPGFDGIQRTTATHFVSKDPETGAINIGNYSGMVHARNRITIGLGLAQHMMTHLKKAKALGRPLQTALVVGAVPAVGYTSVAKVPYGYNEMAVAGGLAGEAIEVVKCQTVDLEVPATAEIVIEGEVSIEYLEPHTGPFGEFTGYMAELHVSPVFNITCITHRKNPILHCFISQMSPSESSKLRQVAFEGNMLKFLKHDCGLHYVQKVAPYEAGQSHFFFVIQLKRTDNPWEAWQALHAAAAFNVGMGRFIIAVDDDIDPWDHESVIWAMGLRCQPHRDTKVITGKRISLDPSTAPPGSPRSELEYPQPSGASAILINATRKWDYPPVALPKREFMERAKEIWEAEGLPTLTPRVPWHGYELGYWPEKYAEAARMNLAGELYKLGEMRKAEREPFV